MKTDRLDDLYDIAYEQELSSFEERLLNIAYKAVNLDELTHVVENTQNVSIQDYTLLKLVLWSIKAKSKPNYGQQA